MHFATDDRCVGKIEENRGQVDRNASGVNYGRRLQMIYIVYNRGNENHKIYGYLFLLHKG